LAGYLAAFDRAGGEPVWKTERPKFQSYSSPVVAPVGGREQLLISGCDMVAAYDPATGRGLWSVPGPSQATCGTIVWDGESVFASGGYPESQTIGVKAGGESGESVWSNRQKCYEQSMLAHDGHLYALTDQGIAYCWRAADGKEMWRERLGGPVSVSPVLVGENIITANEKGEFFVFKADPAAFRSVATNRLGDESFASPAVCGNRLYLRVADTKAGVRRESLYCIGR
jgi:outer membrane protein assembly factor BamB